VHSFVIVAVVLIYALLSARKKARRAAIGSMGEPIALPELPRTPEVRIEPPQSRPRDQAPPVRSIPPVPTAHPRYLLGSPRRRNANDPTAAMMDMMAGPGICTPRDT
jgi:hypothetical protein